MLRKARKTRSTQSRRTKSRAAEPRLARVAAAFKRDRAVTSGGKGFGATGLKVRGKIFAFVSSRGAFVVKLPRERARKLIAARRAVAFAPGRGRAMKEWIAVRLPPAKWAALAKEARDFVGKARTPATKTVPETARLWNEPAPMETGAPRPVIATENGTAWVAYRAQDPGVPGSEHPSATPDLNSGPGEPFGVLRFDNVTELVIGPPSDERLHEHPLYGRGLQHYHFHRVHPSRDRQRRWIVTFRNGTLGVCAKTARAFPLQFTATAEDAIVFAQSPGTR
jgi:hypothetical protein